MTYENINVIAGATGTLLHARGSPLRLLRNTSLSNNVYLFDAQGVSLGGTNYTTLRPLATQVVTGEVDTYGVVVGTAVVVEISPAISASAAPSDIAAQIALSGVPLLSAPTLVASVPAQSVGAISNVTLGPYTIGQTGYEIGLTITCNNASVACSVAVTMQWSDSVTGLVVSTEGWELDASTVALGGQQYFGVGPTKGDTLKILLYNFDPTFAATVKIGITQNSRTYTRDDWRNQTLHATPGAIGPITNNFTANQLFLVSATLGASASLKYTLPLYAGRVKIIAYTSAQLIHITIQDNQYTFNNNQWIGHTSATGYAGVVSDYASLPRTNCLLNIFNEAAVATNIVVSGIIEQSC
jgi:hypothetical protein